MKHNQSRCPLFSLIAISLLIFASAVPAAAQGVPWKKANVPGTRWNSIASSADGNILLAGTYSGPSYLSKDSGATWTATSLSTGVLQGNTVACSADGTVLIVASINGNIWVSTDSGANWTSRAFTSTWTAVACSATGAKLVAANGSQLYTSTDTGATWTPRDTLGSIAGVASSADGTKLIAVTGGSNPGQIYISTDSGATWMTKGPNQPWKSVACSADGSKVVAVDYTEAELFNDLGGVYTSADGGMNWPASPSLIAPSLNYVSVASSADGARLVVASERADLAPALLLTSIDSGANWQLAYAPFNMWTCVASSADGKKLAATSLALVNGASYDTSKGGIYTYAEPSTNAPTLNIATSGSNASLSWPWPSEGFVLQQNTNLATTNWVTVTNTPAVVNQVIGPATNNSTSYRLIKP